MQASTIKTCGLTVAVSVPNSVDEFDQIAKRQGACLTEAISNILYRSFLAEFRDSFCEAIEADTKIARATKVTGKTKGGEDIEVYDESEVNYIKRVAAEKGVEVTHFQSIADAVAASIVFDPSAPERKPSGPKKVGKVYMEFATELVAKGNGAAERVASKLSTLLGRHVEPTAEGLAQAIKDDEVRERKEKMAKLVAA